jgi:RHS repeat-associated protein
MEMWTFDDVALNGQVASTPIPGITTMTGYLCYADRTPSRRPLAPPQVADGTRVAKGRITAWSCDPAVNGFQTTSDYILGPPYENCREQSVEMGMDANNSMAWQHTNVYAAGKLLATYDGVPVDRSSSTGQDNDGLHFYFDDPLPGSPAIGLRRWGGLGTRRAQTDYAGVLEQTCSSLPFGDGLNCITPPNSSGNSYAASLIAPTEHHFTGKERDNESGNDYFGARYYASSMGRFMSPDPMGGHLEDPQTLNRYVYVRNNPLSLTDPTGLDFYLQCTQTKDNSSTCQSQQIGTDNQGKAVMATVQGVSGDNGFTATRVGNDANGGLVDKTTGTGSYTASFDGKSVSLTNDKGQEASGAWLQGSANTSGIQGSGALDKFNFSFTDHNNQTSLEADFTFAGTHEQAADALKAAGYKHWALGEHRGADEFRLPAQGRNSSHFLIMGVTSDPKSGVPTTNGNMHAGEYYPGFNHTWHDVMKMP